MTSFRSRRFTNRSLSLHLEDLEDRTLLAALAGDALVAPLTNPILAEYLQTPLGFESNRGQTDA